MAQIGKLALVLPGVGGGLFGTLIGVIIFLFSLASLGRHETGYYALSPAAGGLLYILLGLAGITGVALALNSRVAIKGLLALCYIVALPGLVVLAVYKEWAACVILLILIGIVGASAYLNKGQKAGSGASLLLSAGVLGFLIGEVFMSFLLCGWKTWSISGVLLIFSGILVSINPEKFWHSLPMLGSNSSHKMLYGYAIYVGLSLILLLLIIIALINVPDEATSAKVALTEAGIAESLGRYDVAIGEYDRLIEVNQSDPYAWYSKGRALEALGRHEESRECYNIANYLDSSNSTAVSSKKPQSSKESIGFGGVGSAKVVSGLSDCDCELKRSINSPVNNSINGLKRDSELEQKCSDCSKNNSLNVSILSPGDVRTFPRGEPITFNGSASCGIAPYTYLWDSSIDGIIGNTATFNKSNLSIGMHIITLTITDSSSAKATDSIDIGISSPSVCAKVNPRPKYYPIDTPCGGIWPNTTRDCMEFEVCHPDLDYIVEDAVNCCDSSTPKPGSACYYAHANSGGDKKKCRALYIIKAFGPEAKYMQGYALFKACCSGYPECTRTCGLSLAGTCAFREGFNKNVTGLSCRPDEWGVDAWKSDDNMSQNSAVLGLFPTHATVNILHTGVCIDYSAAVTTLLRKAGYSRTEALSTAATSYDLMLLGNHPGHAYGLVKLPGDSKYHFVDTTGNGEGINMSGVPSYFWFTGCFLGMSVKIKVFDWWVGYCNKTSSLSYNDAGYFNTPPKSCLVGCR